MKILMVCLGNICRSPLAQGILENMVLSQGLDWEVDSAGIGDWHEGELPDHRSIKLAKKYGIDITNQKARQIKKIDFDYFDFILAMDTDNYNALMRLAQTDQQKSKVHLILNFSRPNLNMVVPDPYYNDKFQLVYDLLIEALEAFVKKHMQVQNQKNRQ